MSSIGTRAPASVSTRLRNGMFSRNQGMVQRRPMRLAPSVVPALTEDQKMALTNEMRNRPQGFIRPNPMSPPMTGAVPMPAAAAPMIQEQPVAPLQPMESPAAAADATMLPEKRASLMRALGL